MPIIGGICHPGRRASRPFVVAQRPDWRDRHALRGQERLHRQNQLLVVSSQLSVFTSDESGEAEGPIAAGVNCGASPGKGRAEQEGESGFTAKTVVSCQFSVVSLHQRRKRRGEGQLRQGRIAGEPLESGSPARGRERFHRQNQLLVVSSQLSRVFTSKTKAVRQRALNCGKG